MTYDLLLLKDGHVVLGILRGTVPVCATACLLYEILGSFEVFSVASNLIELAKGHLDDRMSARTMDLPIIGAEGLADEIGILDGDIEEGLLASSTIMGNGTLDEMT